MKKRDADFQTSYSYTSSLAIQLFSPYIIFNFHSSFFTWDDIPL